MEDWTQGERLISELKTFENIVANWNSLALSLVFLLEGTSLLA